jgi:hypothetical protein
MHIAPVAQLSSIHNTEHQRPTQLSRPQQLESHTNIPNPRCCLATLVHLRDVCAQLHSTALSRRQRCGGTRAKIMFARISSSIKKLL